MTLLKHEEYINNQVAFAHEADRHMYDNSNLATPTLSREYREEESIDSLIEHTYHCSSD